VSSARHRERQRTERGDQLARPVPKAPTTGDRTSLVTPTAERAFQLLLQQLLYEKQTWPRTAPSNGSNQSLQANGDGSCRHGWRNFLHGVGSFSILPIGTYAASSNLWNGPPLSPHGYAGRAIHHLRDATAEDSGV
jgi:hypothetical protein